VSQTEEAPDVIIGPGATEDDFIATLSDEALFPDLTPEGASVMRAFFETPRSNMGLLLSDAILVFDCDSFDVTDETLPDFHRFVGETLLRANGMPEEDIAKVAEELGEEVFLVGVNYLPEEDFVYDSDGELRGLARCS
jgi:hypothetical protein